MVKYVLICSIKDHTADVIPQLFSTTSNRQYPGCIETLSVNTISFKKRPTRDRIFQALHRLALRNGLHFSFKHTLKRSSKGFKRPFGKCQSTIQTTRKRGFQRKYLRDYSRDAKTAKSVTALKTHFLSTQRSSFLDARAKEGPDLNELARILAPSFYIHAGYVCQSM